MKTRVPQRESEFQAAVIELAQLNGWLIHHVFEQKHYARRIGNGFPDLVLVRTGEIIFAELKAEKGRVSPAQMTWIGALTTAAVKAPDAIKVCLWRPRDWPAIEQTLARREAA